MITKRVYNQKAIITILSTGYVLYSLLNLKVQSAEKISFISGPFQRSVDISELEYLSKTGKAKGLTAKIIRFGKQDPKEIARLLNQQTQPSLRLTSKLINSKIGGVVIQRVSKIIYPFKVPDPKVSVPAIRAGLIKGIIIGEGNLSVINFLKGYPNKIISIDVPALFKVMKKVDSISELITFFSDSPLNKLKPSNQSFN